MNRSLVFGLALALSFSLPFSASARSVTNKAKSTTNILACVNTPPVDVAVFARSITRTNNGKTKRKFKVQFEASPEEGYRAGQLITVFVNDVAVGSRKLKRQLNGDLAAKLEYASGLSGNGRFPAKFPKITSGSSLVVKVDDSGVISCGFE